MRKQANVLVALLAAVAVVIPAVGASAATNPNLTQVINAGVQTFDIVDGSNVTVASPSVAFPTKGFSFTCQSSTANLGTGTQKLQIKNQKAGSVSVDMNAATPGTSTWTAGGNTYKYNDATGSGCTNGQLSVTAGATFTKTAGAGSPTVTFPGGSFTGSSPVTVINNTGTVRYEADVTAIPLVQQIPAEQPEGSYSIPMNLTTTIL
jgi:hypothetical protein